jgi:hypothetical protein
MKLQLERMITGASPFKTRQLDIGPREWVDGFHIAGSEVLLADELAASQGFRGSQPTEPALVQVTAPDFDVVSSPHQAKVDVSITACSFTAAVKNRTPLMRRHLITNYPG